MWTNGDSSKAQGVLGRIGSCTVVGHGVERCASPRRRGRANDFVTVIVAPWPLYVSGDDSILAFVPATWSPNRRKVGVSVAVISNLQWSSYNDPTSPQYIEILRGSVTHPLICSPTYRVRFDDLMRVCHWYPQKINESNNIGKFDVTTVIGRSMPTCAIFRTLAQTSLHAPTQHLLWVHEVGYHIW